MKQFPAPLQLFGEKAFPFLLIVNYPVDPVLRIYTRLETDRCLTIESRIYLYTRISFGDSFVRGNHRIPFRFRSRRVIGHLDRVAGQPLATVSNSVIAGERITGYNSPSSSREKCISVRDSKSQTSLVYKFVSVVHEFVSVFFFLFRIDFSYPKSFFCFSLIY